VKETKTAEYFKEKQEKLAKMQNETRDQVLESLTDGKIKEAKSLLEDLQTVSIGLQVCQQSIMRIGDMEAAEEKRKAQLSIVANPPPVQEKPKKKGWFRR
jgi:ERCC4-type nuclease